MPDRIVPLFEPLARLLPLIRSHVTTPLRDVGVRPVHAGVRPVRPDHPVARWIHGVEVAG
ncbi:hypothetical protein ADL22_02455 [Streptomyces sp. NRRL F-4489]|nr:hypothetical protein ADL22_02455 [Streptomyces sp. NRRL F-4489]